VNREEAKNILLLYRPETADAGDPQIAVALALAKQDPELARWLDEHCARQNALRAKFRQIEIPAGLKEQIISERAAQEKFIFWQRNFAPAAVTVMAIIIGFIILAPFWFHSRADDTFAIYRSRMVNTALRGYAMDLAANNPAQIRAYLAQNHAPANFILPAALQQVALTGCAIEHWQGAKVSMICFHDGKPNAPGDLWLFVIDRASVKDVPADASPQFSKVNQLITATWTQDGKLYLLGTEGDAQTIRRFL
jgi:uncharacterized membrane protein YbaN (DUF454 family)